MTAPRLGPRVRALRRKNRLTQADLADRLGISASYLNLIEHGKRQLPARLLLELARIFELDLAAFSAGADGQLLADLEEAFGDPLFDEVDLTEEQLREVVASAPGVARGVIQLYRTYRSARATLDSLGAQLASGFDPVAVPSEEVTDFVQQAMNFFPSLEAGAEGLCRDARLERGALGPGLAGWLQRVHGVEVRLLTVAESRGQDRRWDARRRQLLLSEALGPEARAFEMAHQACLLEMAPELDRLTTSATLTSDESRALARSVLANYYAGATLMPYEPFLEAARSERYDVELLGCRFGASFEQVCHRLTTLRRPGAEGVPFHFVRVDIAGNISKRFSASGIRFARYSGACPRWNVHSAFLTPGAIRTQVSTMPDGTSFFCFARTVSRDRGAWEQQRTFLAVGLGCQLKFARELVYGDGVDLEREDLAVPIGVTCRLCERTDCAQRAFPAMQARVDEELRGGSAGSPGAGGAFGATAPSSSGPAPTRRSGAG